MGGNLSASSVVVFFLLHNLEGGKAVETAKRYKLHMDTIAFSSKPSREGAGSVKKLVPRVSHNIVEITKEEVVDAVIAGYSIIPGLCDMNERKSYQGALQKDWTSQDFFALDFDDGLYTKRQVLSTFEELGIPVFLIHDTYSSTEAKEKFHVFFCAKETVTKKEDRDRFQAILMSVFADGVDRACANRNRYFNGTNKEAYYANFDAEVDVNRVIELYWEGTPSQLSFLPKDSALLSVKKKEKVHREKTEKAERERIVYLLPDETCFEDSTPVVHNGLIKYNLQMKFGEYMELVYGLLETKTYTEGTGRRSLIFDVFNMASFAIGSREAYKLCLEINERFAVPLSEKEFASCVVNSYEHDETGEYRFFHETHYVYRYDTLLSRAGIPNEVKENLSYYKKKKEKEHADAYREPKAERNEYIEELVKAGYGYKKIHKALKERYDGDLALSLSGVRYAVKKLKEEKNEGCSNTAIHLSPTSTSFFESEETEQKEESAGVLNQEQEYAFRLAMEGRNVELIAKAGTGKSYTLAHIKEALESLGKRVAVCAATGLAAQKIGGCTVHRLFGIRPGEEFRLFESVLENLLTYQAVIIDEIGMVDKEAFTAVCKVLYQLEAYYCHPIQLILSGDVLQLQPISGEYYFESPYYPHMELCKVALVQNMRQSDRYFAHLLERLRRGDRSVVWELNRLLTHGEDCDALYIYSRVEKALAKNREILNTLPGELIRLDEKLSVKIGAKVVVTANAKAGCSGVLRYYNGMRGTVTKVGRRTVVIETTDGQTIAIRKQKIVTEDGSYEGYPLLLGYALTAHRTQGMTLDRINIDPSCFADGQLYTGLSRVTTASGVHLLAPIRPWDIKASKKALAFEYETDGEYLFA